MSDVVKFLGTIIISSIMITLYFYISVSVKKKEEDHYEEIRKEKVKFLMSDRFKAATIIEVELQKISNRPLKKYDIFTVLDSNHEIYDIKVMDTRIHNVFKVENVEHLSSREKVSRSNQYRKSQKDLKKVASG